MVIVTCREVFFTPCQATLYTEWWLTISNQNDRWFDNAIEKHPAFTGHLWGIPPVTDRFPRNELLMFYLVSSSTRCWTNSRTVGDLKQHGVNVMGSRIRMSITSIDKLDCHYHIELRIVNGSAEPFSIFLCAINGMCDAMSDINAH